MMVGGSSVTEQTAEQVKPAIPCAPSVETIDTEEATRDNASRNSSEDTRGDGSLTEVAVSQVPKTSAAAGRTSVCVSIVLSNELSALPRSANASLHEDFLVVGLSLSRPDAPRYWEHGY